MSTWQPPCAGLTRVYPLLRQRGQSLAIGRSPGGSGPAGIAVLYSYSGSARGASTPIGRGRGASAPHGSGCVAGQDPRSSFDTPWIAEWGIPMSQSYAEKDLRPLRAAALLAALWALVAPQALGGTPQEAEPYAVLLESGTLEPAAGDYAAGLAYLGEQGAGDTAHLLVQLYETPNAQERADLAAAGLELLSYLPQRTWMARVPVGIGAAELAALGVRWMAPLELEQKVSARTLEGRYGPWTEYADGRRIHAVVMHEDVSEAAGRAILADWTDTLGGYIHSLNAYIAVLEPAEVPALALTDEIRWIAQRPPVLTAVNDELRESLGVEALWNPPYDLDGSGSNILVYDAGLVADHPDFGDRVTHGEGGSNSEHGTHVAGTVGGDGSVGGGAYAGCAPNTAITSYYYESCNPYCLYNSPQDIEENYNEGLYTYGADLATNSLASNIAPNGYDCDWEGDYELTAQLLDAICSGSLGLPFLSCWANGNERHYGRCGTEYYTTGIPATAKDIVAVGATMSDDHSMSWFSSWGPVDDGRLRPDVCAPGCQSAGDGGITSTCYGGTYCVKCGTSMACPAVAGCLALILQEMRQTPGGTIWPLPSTLKALLINTSQDYYHEGPDYQYGYGEIRPQAAVDVLRNSLAWLEAMLDQGEVQTYQFNVTEPMDELKITVAWSDPPGEPLAEIELVNNLDLTLEAPCGTIHYPWILDPDNPDTPATRGIDLINPVEQVLVSDPEQGIWTLHVTGCNVPEGPQSYSLVANLPRYHGASDVAQDGADPAAPGARVGGLHNYPDPFGAATTIQYEAAAAGTPITVEIRDVTGRVVRSLTGRAARGGAQQMQWDGRDGRGQRLPTGVYFYRIAGAPETENRDQRMLILR
ncbi:MAG: S8 family serine peptidase, partial [Candidatus Eisenbacteria bacterium]|nr:S8 family serine peptidase [Candidatus Eisenbacteria bacterium]